MTTNKLDFLNAICAKPESFEIEGMTVQIKGLSVDEVRRVQEISAEDNYKATLLTIMFGLVEPKLTQDDLEALGAATPKTLFPLAERIGELSGMNDDNPDDPNAAGNG